MPCGTVALTDPVAMTIRLFGTSPNSSTASPAVYYCTTIVLGHLITLALLSEPNILTSSSNPGARIVDSTNAELPGNARGFQMQMY